VIPTHPPYGPPLTPETPKELIDITAPHQRAQQHRATHTNADRTSRTGRQSNHVQTPVRVHDDRPGHTREKLTIAEVCAELKVSRSTFYYWRQIGRAPRCMVLPNREVRIRRCDLDDWLDACTEGEA
jgi:excisionase family DNA binding protein